MNSTIQINQEKYDLNVQERSIELDIVSLYALFLFF